MNTSEDDSHSSARKGGWWSSLSQYQQIVAAIVGALVTGLFGLLIVLIGSSSGSPHIGVSNAEGSSPTSVTSPPNTSGTQTNQAPGTPSPASVVADSPSPSSASSSGQYLADLTPVSNSGSFDAASAAVNGKSYLNSVILDMNFGSTSVAYNLERQWRSLEATVGLRDDSNPKDKYEFQVYADGHPIYSHLFALGQSQHIKLSIVGVLRLELRATLVEAYYGEAYGVWGNADLTS